VLSTISRQAEGPQCWMSTGCAMMPVSGFELRHDNEQRRSFERSALPAALTRHTRVQVRTRDSPELGGERRPCRSSEGHEVRPQDDLHCIPIPLSATQPHLGSTYLRTKKCNRILGFCDMVHSEPNLGSASWSFLRQRSSPSIASPVKLLFEAGHGALTTQVALLPLVGIPRSLLC
jgi:hypothetical protein